MTRFPNLFIIGAPKSGTTSLYEWLRGHPQIYMSPVKEPCYFARDLAADRTGGFLRFEDDRERYLALFEPAADAAVVGEASTRYLYSKDAAQLIAAQQPDARIVAVLRNPVDMIASLHAHKLAGGTEDLPDLEGALAAETDRRAGRRIPPDSNPFLATYRDRARFGEQLPRWFDAFGPSKVHVIVFEELIVQPEEQFWRLLEFLGVDDTYRPPSFAAYNIAHGTRSSLIRSALRSRLAQGFVWRVLPALIGDARTRGLSRRLSHSRVTRRPIDRGDVPVALRAELERELGPDVARLSKLLGRDLGEFWFGRSVVSA